MLGRTAGHRGQPAPGTAGTSQAPVALKELSRTLYGEAGYNLNVSNV